MTEKEMLESIYHPKDTTSFMLGLIDYWKAYLMRKQDKTVKNIVFERTNDTVFIYSGKDEKYPFKSFGALMLKYEVRGVLHLSYYNKVMDIILSVRCLGTGEDKREVFSLSSFSEYDEKYEALNKNIWEILERNNERFKNQYHPELGPTYCFKSLNIAQDNIYLKLDEYASDIKGKELEKRLGKILIDYNDLEKTYKEIVDTIYEVDNYLRDVFKDKWQKAFDKFFEDVENILEG